MAVSNIKRIGLGVVLAVQPTTASTFSTVANIAEMISGPDASGADIDTHTLDDGIYETHAKGSVNPGTCSMTLAYDPEDDSGKLLSQMLAQFTPVPIWRLTLPVRDGSTAQVETFSANLMTMGREIPKNGLVTRTVGLQASGNPGFTV